MTEPEPSLPDLAKRVRRLEQLIGGHPTPPAASGPTSPNDADTFWVLAGLAERGLDGVVTYAGSVTSPDGPVHWQMSHATATLLELDWTSLAAALGALGHPVRLRILQLVARGEATSAADLAEVADLGSTGQIYHHLRQLVAAGWLRATTRGHHQVPPERLIPLLVVLAASTS